VSEQNDRGVGADPTARDKELPGGATAENAGVGQQVESTAEGEQAAPQVDLDDLPQFRRWKSATDQRLAEAQRQADEARRQTAQLESELEELRMRDAPPDEQAAFYRTKLAEQRASTERQHEQETQRQQIMGEATEALSELGLEPSTPGLDWSGGPTPVGLATLMRSAARIVAERNRQQAQQSQEEAEEEARTARVEALNAAGVTRTSMATSGAPPAEENPIADIADPAELLRRGTQRALKGTQGQQPPRG
jgi:hypothetical protein